MREGRSAGRSGPAGGFSRAGGSSRRRFDMAALGTCPPRTQATKYSFSYNMHRNVQPENAMLSDRIEGKWIDAFCETFERCGVKAGHGAAILSETQSAPPKLHPRRPSFAR